MGDIVNAVADVFGFGPASKQADAMSDASRMSAQSSREALDLQRRVYEEAVARQEPFRQSGLAAQNRLLTLLGIGPQTAQGGLDGAGGNLLGTPFGAAGDAASPEFGKYAKDFGMSQFQADPGYAFRLAEGQKALERSAAARGGLMGGATGKALLRYGQEAGSQEFNNAFKRYQIEREARLNPLQSLAGVSQTSANTVGGYGQNYANQANQLGMTNAANQGNLALQLGNVRASQYGTAGSALNTALNTDWNALGRRFGYGGYGGGAGDTAGAAAFSGAEQTPSYF